MEERCGNGGAEKVPVIPQVKQRKRRQSLSRGYSPRLRGYLEKELEQMRAGLVPNGGLSTGIFANGALATDNTANGALPRAFLTAPYIIQAGQDVAARLNSIFKTLVGRQSAMVLRATGYVSPLILQRRSSSNGRIILQDKCEIASLNASSTMDNNGRRRTFMSILVKDSCSGYMGGGVVAPLMAITTVTMEVGYFVQPLKPQQAGSALKSTPKAKAEKAAAMAAAAASAPEEKHELAMVLWKPLPDYHQAFAELSTRPKPSPGPQTEPGCSRAGPGSSAADPIILSADLSSFQVVFESNCIDEMEE